MSVITLPSPKAVRDLLTELFAREITLEPRDAWAPSATEPAWVGELVGDDGNLAVAILLDLPLTVQLGAAIGLLPAGLAAEMIKDRDPSELVLTNVQEVLNVLTVVFNTPSNPHARLRQVLKVGPGMSQQLSDAVTSGMGREDYTLTIAGYGPGRLGLIVG